jgi:Fe2+ transport system protein FeoA
MSRQDSDASAVTAAATAMPLNALGDGVLAQVVDVVAEADDAVRLKSLGVCVGRRVQLVKGGDPLIVRVLGARVGLSARLAAGVAVRPLD